MFRQIKPQGIVATWTLTKKKKKMLKEVLQSERKPYQMETEVQTKEERVLEKISMWVNTKDAGFLILNVHLKITDHLEQEKCSILYWRVYYHLQDTAGRGEAMQRHHCKALALQLKWYMLWRKPAIS